MKVHQTFRIDPELLKKVKKQAKKENRKPCNLYETAILFYLETENIKSKISSKNELERQLKDLKSKI